MYEIQNQIFRIMWALHYFEKVSPASLLHHYDINFTYFIFRSNLVSQTHRAAKPNGNIVTSVSVEKFADTVWEVTLDLANCGLGVPLFAIHGLNSTSLTQNSHRFTTPASSSDPSDPDRSFTVTRTQRISGGLKGSFDVTFNKRIIKSKCI